MKVHETANYLAIGTHARSMYKLDLSLLTGTGETPAEPVAQTFQLKQNYPNPFNPSTTIPYTLNESSLTKLTIYNTLGQEVRTLVNENQGPGVYGVVWDGRDNSNRLVASGTYIYRLQTDDFTRTRRMTFLK